MRESPHKRLICASLRNSQIQDAIRAGYQPWQSQRSNAERTQFEARTRLPAKNHGLTSSSNAIKIIYFTVKLQLRTVYTELE